MYKLIKLFILIASLGIVIASCNQKKKTENQGFEIQGQIKGFTNEEVVLTITDEEDKQTLKTKMNDGKFIFKGKLNIPQVARIAVGKSKFFAYVHIQNSKMTFKADKNIVREFELKGSKFHNDYIKYRSIINKYNVDNSLYSELRQIKTTKKRKEEIRLLIKKASAEINKNVAEFFNQNPASDIVAFMLKLKINGQSIEEIEKLIAKAHPLTQKNKIICLLKKRITKLKEIEIGIDKILGNVEDINFTLDNSFKGETYKNLKYLSVFNNGNICGLHKNGKISIISPKGKLINSIDSNLKGDPKSIAVDNNNTIFLAYSTGEFKEFKSRGRKFKRFIPNGIMCNTYNQSGKFIKELKLKGAEIASGFKIVNNKLIISDSNTKKVYIYNKNNGELISTIDKMRSCCGILDLSIRNNNEILVANLGAFRVQSFDLNGKIKLAFGKRGSGINDFHGCCNPVSCATLNNGAIVTVEKDPTRIKIYSKNGAKQIQGIQELVKGCAYIPMAVDPNNSLYLASGNKGIIKCIPIK